MTLKATYSDAGEIPEAHKDLYTEQNGTWKLAVEGVKTDEDIEKLSKALQSEREANKGNATKIKELNEQLKKWADFDPEQVRNVMERINQDEETRLISEGKLDEVLSKRTERMKADFGSQLGSRDKRIQEMEQTLKAKDEQLDRIIIDGAVREVAVKSEGFRKSAIDDAVIRGRSMFVRDEHGNPVARDANGDLIMSKDGKSALGPAEWLDSMKEVADHWWESSTGGGTQPGRAGAERIKNPWKKDTFNLTEQGRIFKENPDLAARLKNEATNH